MSRFQDILVAVIKRQFAVQRKLKNNEQMVFQKNTTKGSNNIPPQIFNI